MRKVTANRGTVIDAGSVIRAETKPHNVSSVDALLLTNRFQPLQNLSFNDHVDVMSTYDDKIVSTNLTCKVPDNNTQRTSSE